MMLWTSAFMITIVLQNFSENFISLAMPLASAIEINSAIQIFKMGLS